MKKVTRRYFIKSLAGFLVALTVGWYVMTRLFRPIQLFNPGKSLPGGEDEGILVVSDVDAHSQCAMRVKIKEDKMIEVRGVPEDPESQGELTVRDRHIKDFLYSPDRLKYPLKRIGKKGEGKWQQIPWEQAFNEIADKVKEIRDKYGPEAIAGTVGTQRTQEEFVGRNAISRLIAGICTVHRQELMNSFIPSVSKRREVSLRERES